jgi:hypothetical protein
VHGALVHLESAGSLQFLATDDFDFNSLFDKVNKIQRRTFTKNKTNGSPNLGNPERVHWDITQGVP